MIRRDAGRVCRYEAPADEIVGRLDGCTRPSLLGRARGRRLAAVDQLVEELLISDRDRIARAGVANVDRATSCEEVRRGRRLFDEHEKHRSAARFGQRQPASAERRQRQ